MRKTFFRTISIFLVLAFVGNTRAKAQKKPNIIWLMAEDISLDLSCYGMKAVHTPNIDALASGGLKFTNCYTTNSICSPSRSAMMTGMHQLQINAEHHRSNHDVPLPEAVKPFTYYLRQAGYECILGSELVRGKGRKIDCNFKTKPLGPYDGIKNFGLFDKYDVITPSEKPFFAQIQLVTTHRGDWWDETRAKSKHPVNPDSVELPAFLPDDPIVRLDWAKYLDQMEYIDNEVGIIIADLKKKDLYENTVIIFIGDNGRCNVFGKGYLHDSGLHVPFIMNWPKGIKNPAVRTDVVSAVDITATILELAGVPILSNMNGRSVFDKTFKRDYVYGSRDTWDEILDKSRSVSAKDFAYIRNDMPWIPWDAHQTYLEFYRPAVHVMRTLRLEGKLGKSQSTFLSPVKPDEELYDMQKDPMQLTNLANDPGYKEKLAEMRKIASTEDKKLAPAVKVFHPVTPISVEVYDFVKYKYPEEYRAMLNGKEIGFQKFTGIYKDYLKSKGIEVTEDNN